MSMIEQVDMSSGPSTPEWHKAAYEAFCRHAALGHDFTTEQVRLANPHLSGPFDWRRWGAIAIRAKREGVVVINYFTFAKSPQSSARVVRVWKPA